MTIDQPRQKPHTLPGKMEVPYRTYAGPIASRFFVEIRDNKKLYGTKCAKCKKVYVPPKSVCPGCFTRLSEFVGVSDEGTVMSFTEVRYKEPVQPVDPPFITGIIKLDGADTGLVHFIGETDAAKVSIGMRVKAVFKEKREGNILDIKYFKPV